jgi:twitching motility protein PilT
MAHLDRFLSALVSNGGSALHLTTDEVARLIVGDVPRPVTKQPFSAAQLLMLVREIAPDDAMRRLESGDEATFAYETPDGAFQASGRSSGGKLRVEIVPIEAGVAGARAAPAQVNGNGASASAKGARASVFTSREEERAGDPVALAEVETLLKAMLAESASDLHLRVGEPPILRTHGEMKRLRNAPPLGNDAVEAMLLAMMPERNRLQFEELNDTDFAYELPGSARFRCNALRDRRGVGAVFRVIPATVVTVEQMGLSEEVQRLCHLTKGLVLVTGPTGSGKSTTLCALVDLINRVRHDHVITIEDPIEFVHPNKNCLITQRQVGSHTSSFKHALRAALREDPDIVLVGELRDLETVSIAIETAETGHLVFGTLHTTSAVSTIDRLIDQFPADRQDQVRVMLSESLKGVISQTLCRKIGGGRIAAREVLLSIPAVANLIREAKTFQIPSIMQTSKRLGMVTLNDALIDLVDRELVESKEAYYKAIDKQGFANMLRQRGHDAGFLEGDVAAAMSGKAEQPAQRVAARK